VEKKKTKHNQIGLQY